MSSSPALPCPYAKALLPWEDRAEFEALRGAWYGEHTPEGPAESGLVDQLAWCQWRQRRLVLGERAAHMAALQDRARSDATTSETIRRSLAATGQRGERDELAEAIASTEANDEALLRDASEDEAYTRRAIAILETRDPAAYGEAIAALRDDTTGWWEDVVGDDEQTHPDRLPNDGNSYLPFTRTGSSLLRFLNEQVLPIFEKTRGQVARRPAIRLQAQGESVDPFRMDRILALDERLSRQFEKALAMLLKLKELRAASEAKR